MSTKLPPHLGLFGALHYQSDTPLDPNPVNITTIEVMDAYMAGRPVFVVLEPGDATRYEFTLQRMSRRDGWTIAGLPQSREYDGGAFIITLWQSGDPGPSFYIAEDNLDSHARLCEQVKSDYDWARFVDGIDAEVLGYWQLTEGVRVGSSAWWTRIILSWWCRGLAATVRAKEGR